ncbi:M14 family metallopeptidase [Arsukibacterium indicum]|uniref:M14 family metallocarboxypeptidase n=1 Tax=Arsukibacterium indicum TaxID=2848612 RepID=A0ABS6MIR8_9GAMM|nr:M14 family metallocarboxypeptidase [Arsukibacterium indicum]MBV2128706.1 M14 family metallocarboxypeptidase [Arsukibacterium indicum]
MTASQEYDIGVAGQPWGPAENAQWLARQQIQRSYQQQVLSRLEQVAPGFTRQQYGELDYRQYGAESYPLYAFSNGLAVDKVTVLVTGGVHGYETSGVQGAIRFLQTEAANYSDHFNLILLPCISPWGYETINRWNPQALDPNRNFTADSPVAESAAVVNFLLQLSLPVLAHIDLHETTDSDNSEFRPAKAARDGEVNTNWDIPDGFYLVGDSEKPAADFQQAINLAVSKVTQIAPADADGCLIGEPISQPGVVNYPKKSLGLCGGITDAPYVTTTEVYPDSPHASPEQCIVAQVTAIVAALEFLKSKGY